MTAFRTTALPTITCPIAVDVPELADGAPVYTLVSLIGTPLQDFPAGSPVHVEPEAFTPIPEPGSSGPVIQGASLLPGAQLRLLWRGPSFTGVGTIRVTAFPSLQID